MAGIQRLPVNCLDSVASEVMLWLDSGYTADEIIVLLNGGKDAAQVVLDDDTVRLSFRKY